MDNAIVVNKTAHSTTVGLLFEVNNIQGYGLALGLAILALACVLAKCLFLYYIQVHAPKERPLNKLLALEQVLVLVLVFIELLGDPAAQSGVWITNKCYKLTNPVSNKHIIEILVIQ